MHERVGDCLAERLGHRVLLLEQQPVAGPARPTMELDPRREERAVGLFEDGVVALPQEVPRRLGPAEGVHVAEPAAALLQVGLEEERHLAGASWRSRTRRESSSSHRLERFCHCSSERRGQVVGEILVAGHVAHLQERGGGVEVVGGERQRLLRRAHRVPELHSLVPDRVPDAIGQGADVGAPGVEQHDVDVGLQAELGAAVAADGDQGHPAGAALRLAPSRGARASQPSTRSL